MSWALLHAAPTRCAGERARADLWALKVAGAGSVQAQHWCVSRPSLLTLLWVPGAQALEGRKLKASPAASKAAGDAAAGTCDKKTHTPVNDEAECNIICEDSYMKKIAAGGNWSTAPKVYKSDTGRDRCPRRGAAKARL